METILEMKKLFEAGKHATTIYHLVKKVKEMLK